MNRRRVHARPMAEHRRREGLRVLAVTAVEGVVFVVTIAAIWLLIVVAGGSHV